MKPLIVLCAVFFLALAGCSKDKGSEPECRIVKITEAGGNLEIFNYDTEGRLQSINYGGSVTSFTYRGDSIIKQSVWKSVYALNSNGLLAFERREYNSTGTQWETRHYEYDGIQLKKMTANSYSGNFTRTYTWSNGNLMLEHTQGATYSQDIQYEYYMDKSYRLGDVQSWDLLENGVEMIRNKNLVKKVTSTYVDNSPSNPTPGVPETDVKSYSYLFGSDGKINSMTVTDQNNSNPSMYTYDYQCK